MSRHQGSPPGFGPSPFESEPAAGREPITLDVLDAIARERLPANASPDLVLPNTPSAHHGHQQPADPSGTLPAAVIRWKAPRPQDRAYIHVDMYSGKVLADYRWSDFGVIGKLTVMAVALHEGTWFGAWNQVLNSLVALGVLWFALSGLVMWWKRRPAGGFLAVPPAAADSRMPRSLKGLIALSCVLVPIAGFSLLAVVLADMLVSGILRRVPA